MKEIRESLEVQSSPVVALSIQVYHNAAGGQAEPHRRPQRVICRRRPPVIVSPACTTVWHINRSGSGRLIIREGVAIRSARVENMMLHEASGEMTASRATGQTSELAEQVGVLHVARCSIPLHRLTSVSQDEIATSGLWNVQSTASISLLTTHAATAVFLVCDAGEDKAMIASHTRHTLLSTMYSIK